MSPKFGKLFSKGDILAVIDGCGEVDLEERSLVCVDDPDHYFNFYILTCVDGKGRFPMENKDVERCYEKIGECDGADELLFMGHITFKEDRHDG